MEKLKKKADKAMLKKRLGKKGRRRIAEARSAEEALMQATKDREDKEKAEREAAEKLAEKLEGELEVTEGKRTVNFKVAVVQKVFLTFPEAERRAEERDAVDREQKIALAKVEAWLATKSAAEELKADVAGKKAQLKDELVEHQMEVALLYRELNRQTDNLYELEGRAKSFAKGEPIELHRFSTQE